MSINTSGRFAHIAMLLLFSALMSLLVTSEAYATSCISSGVSQEYSYAKAVIQAEILEIKKGDGVQEVAIKPTRYWKIEKRVPRIIYIENNPFDSGHRVKVGEEYIFFLDTAEGRPFIGVCSRMEKVPEGLLFLMQKEARHVD